MNLATSRSRNFINTDLISSDYRPDIDGLRAIAVLAVIGFHAFPDWVSGGFIGVDIFFVISGFLITGILLKQMQAKPEQSFYAFISHFYARRIVRIFPALLIVLTFCYVLGWFTLFDTEYQQLGKHIAAGAGFVANFSLWTEAGYFDNTADTKPLLHLWSLGVEEQFYLVWPIVFWIVWARRLNTFVVALVIACISFFLMRENITHDAVATFFLPQTRVWELLLGAALASAQLTSPFERTCQLLQKLWPAVDFSSSSNFNALRNWSAGIGGVFIFLAVRSQAFHQPWPNGRALPLCLAVIVILIAGPNAWFNRKILSNRTLVRIGLISYPLYLWHWSLLSFAQILDGVTLSNHTRICVVLLSFVLATITYLWIEKPLRYGTSWGKWLGVQNHYYLPRYKNHVKVGTLCVLMALIGFAGYQAFLHGGFGWRWLATTSQIQAMHKQFKAVDIEEPKAACRKNFPDFFAMSCVLANGSVPPTVALLGDSHSSHSYSGLAEIYQAMGQNLINLAEGGQVPFFNVLSDQKGTSIQTTKAKMERMNHALSFAMSSTSIKTLILTSRAPMYLTGKGFGFGGGTVSDEQAMNRYLQLSTNPALTAYPVVFETAMRETLMRLTASGKEIIYIVDVPELGFDPKECVIPRLALPLWLNPRQIRSSCAVPRKDFDNRTAEYHSLVARVVKDFPNVKVFKAWQAFCDINYCWAMQNESMLYRDDDHLSQAGSMQQALAFSRWLEGEPTD